MNRRLCSSKRPAFLWVAWVLVCWSGLACKGTEPTRRGAQPLGNPVVERGRIGALLERFQAADRAASLSDLLGCFIEDAEFVPVEGTKLVGVLEIGRHYDALFARGRREATLLVEEVQQEFESAVVVGELKGRTGPPGSSSGSVFRQRCSLELQRRSMGWRIARMTWAPLSQP